MPCLILSVIDRYSKVEWCQVLHVRSRIYLCQQLYLSLKIKIQPDLQLRQTLSVELFKQFLIYNKMTDAKYFALCFVDVLRLLPRVSNIIFERSSGISIFTIGLDICIYPNSQ